jgi:hypothetical protein
MRQFIARYHDKIRGVLSGFDRVLFRGHLTSLWYEKGLRHFLAAHRGGAATNGRFPGTGPCRGPAAVGSTSPARSA